MIYSSFVVGSYFHDPCHKRLKKEPIIQIFAKFTRGQAEHS